MSMRRAIRLGVRNLRFWLPTIWLDRDWDFGYIFLILRRKLINMERAIQHSSWVDCEKEADNIKECVMLLNRIVANEGAYYDGEEADIERLFMLMNKHIQSWWW